MIISSGRRYIFVHAPKTGGTALTLALEDRAMADDILIGDTPKALRRRKRLKGLTARGRLWKHATLADIDGLVDATELDAFLIFTLVRNPWDRMVSYYHWLQTQTFDHPVVWLARSLDFADFVLHASVQSSFQSAPFGSYVTDITGQERAAHFIRLEHLEQDLRPVEAHLGFALSDIPRANVSARDRDYRRYYNEITQQAVAAACAVDIARFGYEF